MMNKFSPANCPQTYVNQNMMGPNVLRLVEELSRSLELWPGMRILDLGCGTGLSSMYLATEFGVEVVAADLWVRADDNARRFAAAGMDNKITPINLDISTLPGLGILPATPLMPWSVSMPGTILQAMPCSLTSALRLMSKAAERWLLSSRVCAAAMLKRDLKSMRSLLAASPFLPPTAGAQSGPGASILRSISAVIWHPAVRRG